MRIRYDPETDAMYITLRKDKVERTQEADKDTIIDFNKDNQVIGVELLFVKERNPDLLKDFRAEKIISA